MASFHGCLSCILQDGLLIPDHQEIFMVVCPNQEWFIFQISHKQADKTMQRGRGQQIHFLRANVGPM